MAWSDYLLALKNLGPNNASFYSPYLDLQGPLYFLPKHCLGTIELPYPSPLIAFIK